MFLSAGGEREHGEQADADPPPRRLADLINISSVAGRQSNAINGVYAPTRFGVNGFTESLRQEITKCQVRIGVVEPGAVETDLVSQNRPEIWDGVLWPSIQTLVAGDVAETIACIVTRPRRAAVTDLWIGRTEQS